MLDDIGVVSEPEQHDFPQGDTSTSIDPASSQAPPSEGITMGGADPAVEIFDVRASDDFDGLLYLGALTDTFVWAGHRFVINTLTTGDYLEVGLIHKKYLNTMADSRAYVTAMVAAAVVSVDGQRLPEPITNIPSDTHLENRFRYIVDHWFPWTIDAVYNRFVLLEKRVDDALVMMGEADSRTA